MSDAWVAGFLLLTIVVRFIPVGGRRGHDHPDYGLTLEQRVRKHGYPIEAHKIVTEDDYIITAYNIPHGLNKEAHDARNKSSVLLLHGMGGFPQNYLVLGKNRSAPYYFADMGMDVWLFSARGLEGSFREKHKTLDWNKDRQYWQHSLHEIGKYDLTATIDYIRNRTGQEKVFLIGHSAGGNEFFCMFSERPDYNTKVKAAINWASSPIIKGMHYPLMLFFCVLVDVIKGLLDYLGMVEILTLVQTLKPTLRYMCSDPDWQIVCIKMTGIIGSHQSVLQNSEIIQLLIGDIPRLSSRQVLHFMDNVKVGKFQQYNHGPKGNMQYYGQVHPPAYNLSATQVPVAFFIGPNDSEITREDVQAAINEIPSTVLLHEVAFPKFTHLDFILGWNSTELVYEPTYRLMKDIDDGVVYPTTNGPTYRYG